MDKFFLNVMLISTHDQRMSASSQKCPKNSKITLSLRMTRVKLRVRVYAWLWWQKWQFPAMLNSTLKVHIFKSSTWNIAKLFKIPQKSTTNNKKGTPCKISKFRFSSRVYTTVSRVKRSSGKSLSRL